MKITINGDTRDTTENITLAAVMKDYGIPERGVAVAVDGTVVPKAAWSQTTLTPGAAIEVLTAVQGG